MFCKNCGKKLEGEYNFCPYCTVKIDTEKQTMFCKKCGEKLDKGINFCANCGAKVASIASTKDIAVKPVQQLQKDPWLMGLSVSGIVIPIIYLYCFFVGRTIFAHLKEMDWKNVWTQSVGVASFIRLYGFPVLFAVLVLQSSLKYKKKSIIGLALFTLIFYGCWLFANFHGDYIFHFLQYGLRQFEPFRHFLAAFRHIAAGGTFNIDIAAALFALIDLLWPIVFSMFSVVWGYRQMKYYKINQKQ
jgi:DNA-directed RNA polymerase subunit RPC12/RpoP